jgi:hypothetical protein
VCEYLPACRRKRGHPKKKDGRTNTHEKGTSMDGLYPVADDDYNSTKTIIQAHVT